MENFDNTFNSLFNIGDALNQIQDKVANISATGEAGAGDIKATVNGKRELVKIEIEDSMINLKNKEVLQDLIVGAVNSAMANVTGKIRTEIVPDSVMDMISDINK